MAFVKLVGVGNGVDVMVAVNAVKYCHVMVTKEDVVIPATISVVVHVNFEVVIPTGKLETDTVVEDSFGVVMT